MYVVSIRIVIEIMASCQKLELIELVCLFSRTDCVFSPDEQLIMTGTSVRKGQVCTLMVQVTVRHLDVVHCHLHVHKTLSPVSRRLKNWSLNEANRTLRWISSLFIPSLPFVFLVSTPTHPSPTHSSPTHPSPTHPSPTHPSPTYQGSGRLMFYDKELKQLHQLPVSDSVSSPRISICALNNNVIDR